MKLIAKKNKEIQILMAYILVYLNIQHALVQAMQTVLAAKCVHMTM